MDLYSETILEYYKNPINKGELKGATHYALELNPMCGDKVAVFLKVDPKTQIITEAKFTGEGCAISQAATSMLTEKLIGLTLKQAGSLTNEDTYSMLGIQISPGRSKCALLGLIATKNAIK